MKHNYIYLAIILGALSLCCGSLSARNMVGPSVHIHSGEFTYAFSDVDSITLHSSDEGQWGIIFPQDGVEDTSVTQPASQRWKVWSLQDIVGSYVSEDGKSYWSIDATGVRKIWNLKSSGDTTPIWFSYEDEIALYANQIVWSDVSGVSDYYTLVDVVPENGGFTYVSYNSLVMDQKTRTFIKVDSIPSDVIQPRELVSSGVTYSLRSIEGKWSYDDISCEIIATSDTSGTISRTVSGLSMGDEAVLLKDDILTISGTITWKIIDIEPAFFIILTEENELLPFGNVSQDDERENKKLDSEVQISFGTVTINPSENDTITPIENPDPQIEEHGDGNDIIITPFIDESDADNHLQEIKEDETQP